LRDEIGELSGSAESSLSAQAHSSSIIIAERSIPIVAVLNDETGIMGEMNLRIIPGNNDILINTNPFSEPDVQYAIKTAVTYAVSKTPDYKYDKDFVFNFSSTGANLIGGESAGAQRQSSP